MLSRVLFALLIVGVPVAVSLGVGKAMQVYSGRERLSASGAAKPLYQRWGYTPAEVVAYWKEVSRQASGRGLAVERRFQELDLLYPFVYGGLLAAALLLAWVRLGRGFSPAWVLLPVALLMLCDWTENVVQLAQLTRYEHGKPLASHWIQVASIATMLKLALLGLVGMELIGLAGAIVVRGPGRLGRSKSVNVELHSHRAEES